MTNTLRVLNLSLEVHFNPVLFTLGEVKHNTEQIIGSSFWKRQCIVGWQTISGGRT